MQQFELLNSLQAFLNKESIIKIIQSHSDKLFIEVGEVIQRWVSKTDIQTFKIPALAKNPSLVPFVSASGNLYYSNFNSYAKVKLNT